MQFYMAPMEGIGGYVYRNAYHKYFEPFDKYFLPFISPNPKGKFAPWELADVLPEHNSGMYAVPQILTNRAEDFIQTAMQLQNMGYEEVNLNLGCPSKTVVAKGRGSGFLQEPNKLNRFLEEIFRTLDMKISIKTRIGFWDSDEFEELLKIYNQYPLEELIIHPRVQRDYYKNQPDWQIYKDAVEKSKNLVCYNGDIFSKKTYLEWRKDFPNENTVMIGRGVLFSPDILGKIKEDRHYRKEIYREFHDTLLEGYLETIHGKQNAIFKMKELWNYAFYGLKNLDNSLMQRIRQASSPTEYSKAVEAFFAQMDGKQERE